MANANPKSRPRKYERTLTVSTSSHSPHVRDSGSQQWTSHDGEGVHRTVPYIRLKGLWLETAGFQPERKVRVEVSHGRLVITHR